MDPGIRNLRRILLIFFITLLWREVAMENDRNFKMCGLWKHHHGSRNLVYDLKTGCGDMSISANESSLMIHGPITAQCVKSGLKSLSPSPRPSPFCVHWEPLLDMLVVEVGDDQFPLCESQGVQTNCCTDLSSRKPTPARQYGIENASVFGDPLNSDLMVEYGFFGGVINCKEKFCDEEINEARDANRIEDAVLRSNTVGNVELPCATSSVIVMKENFPGYKLTMSAKPDSPTVHLPADIKPLNKTTSKVICTYFKDSSIFQSSVKVLDEVIGISVENEVITNLPEPIRIKFHHSHILANQSAKCVSWDTRKDNEVTWREDGCVTRHINTKETECSCNHLTYFAILVQVKPTKTLRHLQALTYITAVGCAVSIVSCVVLFISLCRILKDSKTPEVKRSSSWVLCGLVVALFFLCLLFVLTGTIANLDHDGLCTVVGALLHYALLSALCWMAVEVIHTFCTICMVLKRLNPKPWIWYLLGFGLPVLPVVTLLFIGDIYGERIVMPSGEGAKPYRMCWMKESGAAILAHIILNVGVLVLVVGSGLVMLLLVVMVKNKLKWKDNGEKFLLIWGFSCLFGTTWALAFGTASETIVFLFCIINSLQGFFLMLRFCVVERVQRKRRSDSTSNTGFTPHSSSSSMERKDLIK